MAIMVVCGALLAVGLAAGAAWGDRPFTPPAVDVELSPSETARRFTWYASLMLTGGVIAGVTVIGAGGRLVMRLLAVTAGDDAQGRVTEAEEIVGSITLEGTIGFLVFNGIIGGVGAAACYLVVRRILPRRWLGGALFGLGLLDCRGYNPRPPSRREP